MVLVILVQQKDLEYILNSCWLDVEQQELVVLVEQVQQVFCIFQ